VEGSRIVVNVKFTFDKQSLENVKNSSLISEIIQSVCDKKMSVIGVVVKQQSQNTASAAETISEVLKVFGGELVE